MVGDADSGLLRQCSAARHATRKARSLRCQASMMSVAQVDDVRQVNGYAAPAWTRPRSRRVQVGHLRHDALATDAADPALGVSHETSTTSRVFLLAPLSRLGHDQVTHPLQTPRPTASGSVLALPNGAHPVPVARPNLRGRDAECSSCGARLGLERRTGGRGRAVGTHRGELPAAAPGARRGGEEFGRAHSATRDCALVASSRCPEGCQNSDSVNLGLSLWVPKTRFPCKSARSQKAISALGVRDAWAAADWWGDRSVLVGLQRRLIYFPFPAQVPGAAAVVAGARR
jgi:hypothetical protein